MEEWPEKEAFKATTHFIHRGDFIDALLGVLPEGMVKLDHRLVSIVDNGATATATFANGAVVEADLIVGADGIRSQVRQHLFSDRAPVFAGEHAYRIVIPQSDTFGIVDDGNFRMFMGRGTKIYLPLLLHRGEPSYDVTSLSADPSPVPAFNKEELLRVAQGFDDKLVKITEGLNPAQVNLRAVYDSDPVDRWHSDCVALIGDAAQAMLNHQGQGANSAVLDAYQANRKPVTDELQRTSRQGWSEDEIKTVFPNQRPGEIAARS